MGSLYRLPLGARPRRAESRGGGRTARRSVVKEVLCRAQGRKSGVSSGRLWHPACGALGRGQRHMLVVPNGCWNFSFLSESPHEGSRAAAGAAGKPCHAPATSAPENCTLCHTAAFSTRLEPLYDSHLPAEVCSAMVTVHLQNSSVLLRLQCGSRVLTELLIFSGDAALSSRFRSNCSA